MIKKLLTTLIFILLVLSESELPEPAEKELLVNKNNNKSINIFFLIIQIFSFGLMVLIVVHSLLNFL